VRELRNAIERAAVLSRGEVITPECLPEALFQPSSATQAGLNPRNRPVSDIFSTSLLRNSKVLLQFEMFRESLLPLFANC